MANHNKKFTLFIIGFILFGVYCFVLSDSGLLRRMALNQEIAHIESLKNQRERSIQTFKQADDENNMSILLFKKSIETGYVPKGASVFMFKHDQAQDFAPRHGVSADRYYKYIEYGQILWLTLSVLIIIGILLYYRNRNVL